MLLAFYAVDAFLDAHERRLPAITSTGMREMFRRKLAEVELRSDAGRFASPVRRR